MEHELKTDAEVFDAMACGDKRFDIRKDDRGFKDGDSLKFMKTKYTGVEMAAGAGLEYVGDSLWVWVTHILKGPAYGVPDGFVIMSIVFQDPDRAPGDVLLDCFRVLADGFAASAEFWRTTDTDPHDISTAMYASLNESRHICEKAVTHARTHKR